MLPAAKQTGMQSKKACFASFGSKGSANWIYWKQTEDSLKITKRLHVLLPKEAKHAINHTKDKKPDS